SAAAGPSPAAVELAVPAVEGVASAEAVSDGTVPAGAAAAVSASACLAFAPRAESRAPRPVVPPAYRIPARTVFLTPRLPRACGLSPFICNLHDWMEFSLQRYGGDPPSSSARSLAACVSPPFWLRLSPLGAGVDAPSEEPDDLPENPSPCADGHPGRRRQGWQMKHPGARRQR